MKKGFTVLELLVVIFIIGIISTIVFVYVWGILESARFASAQQFDATIHNALGAELVGEWLFDTVVGDETPDTSGFGNTGIRGVGAFDPPLYGIVGMAV